MEMHTDNYTLHNIEKENAQINEKETFKELKNDLNCHDNPALNIDGLNDELTNDRHSTPKDINAHVSYFKLFRFASFDELLMIFFGIFFASIASLGLPLCVILYGEFSTLFIDRTSSIIGASTPTRILQLFGGGEILTNETHKDNHRLALLDDSKAFAIGSIFISTIQFIFGAISIDIINYSALKQISRIKELFLKSVLRQDMAWYDTNTENNFAVRLTHDLENIKEGISEKLSIFIYLLMTFIFSVIFSFFYGWKLTLVMLSCSPIIIFATALVAKIQSTLIEKELKSYSSAGSVAEEVFNSIRTVIAFGGEKLELIRYKERLRSAEKACKIKGIFTGIGGGIIWLIIFFCYGLAWWYGIKLIIVKEYTPAVLVIVLFGILIAAQNLGLTSKHFESFSTARGSAKAIYSIIDRKPLIDSLCEKGLHPITIRGDIKFKNIHFSYPARPNTKVLNGLNVTIKAGETVALVGISGCGKSTCLQLLQRFYDPETGSVEVDGVNITELNTNYLRSIIGVVGQEPVLFATTIGENIRYGKPEVTQAEVEESAKLANCHDFISLLPNRYETIIGERGSQLSGGQKQRIAIARALVKNPRILLLDEGLSALDSQSEHKVQKNLERTREGRTTIIISHGLSTIKNSDKIVFIENGTVKEAGTHDELMIVKGLYFNLVNASNLKVKEKSTAAKPLHNRYNMQTESINESGIYVSSDDWHDSELEDDGAEQNHSVSIFRLLKMNAPEWPYIFVGCISAVIVGSSLPIFAILFGEFYGILSIEDSEEVLSKANKFSIFFILLGLITGIGTFLQTFMFNISGIRLTSRLRLKVFNAIMKQEMGWFDEIKNSVGALCVRLFSDCSNVQGAICLIGVFFQAFSTIFFGVIISFYFSWNLTLVSIITIPIILFTVYFEFKYMTASNIDEKHGIENATKIAVEAISNIKTIASLCQEVPVLNRYIVENNKVNKLCRKKIRLRGTVYSIGQAIPFFCYGLSFYYGGTLIANEGLHYKNVIKVSEALIFGTLMLAQGLTYAPNYNSAIISAGRLLNLLDRKPKIGNLSPVSENKQSKVEGNITFSEVEYHYPTRPRVPILKGLDLEIKTGQTVALVGSSGCGKSTCIQLLLRFYDPDAGSVAVDGKATINFPVDHLRSQISIVSQEPVLFDRTIAENISYGDNSRNIQMTEIISAAKIANIHKFVTSLPKGYNTSLGANGSQLSGGQKQRIAIARALIRNPKILLLDEATSALDIQNEEIVQNALDHAKTGRTCIVIAHRLTTICNSDIICVLNDGVIIENGTHEELITLGKQYAKFYSVQQAT